MKAVVLFLAVLVAILNVAFGFAPVSSVSRTSSRASTIVMDGKTRALRDRIKSVKNTRRITEAMRLVAAARVRRAQEAVLQTRPFIATLQKVFIHFEFLLSLENTHYFFALREVIPCCLERLH